jgi:hypothetical protein
MGWGGKSGIVALARASGQSPPHGGDYFRFGNERAKPLAVPARTGMEAISLPQPQRGTRTAPLQRCDAAGRPARGPVGQRASGKSGGKSASGSVRKRRTLKERSGKECDLESSRSTSAALDRYRNRTRLMAWFAQRIERFARRAAAMILRSCKSFFAPALRRYFASCRFILL